jgi:hypothetical protein
LDHRQNLRTQITPVEYGPPISAMPASVRADLRIEVRGNVLFEIETPYTERMRCSGTVKGLWGSEGRIPRAALNQRSNEFSPLPESCCSRGRRPRPARHDRLQHDLGGSRVRGRRLPMPSLTFRHSRCCYRLPVARRTILPLFDLSPNTENVLGEIMGW